MVSRRGRRAGDREVRGHRIRAGIAVQHHVQQDRLVRADRLRRRQLDQRHDRDDLLRGADIAGRVGRPVRDDVTARGKGAELRSTYCHGTNAIARVRGRGSAQRDRGQGTRRVHRDVRRRRHYGHRIVATRICAVLEFLQVREEVPIRIEPGVGWIVRVQPIGNLEAVGHAVAVRIGATSGKDHHGRSRRAGITGPIDRGERHERGADREDGRRVVGDEHGAIHQVGGGGGIDERLYQHSATADLPVASLDDGEVVRRRDCRGRGVDDRHGAHGGAAVTRQVLRRECHLSRAQTKLRRWVDRGGRQRAIDGIAGGSTGQECGDRGIGCRRAVAGGGFDNDRRRRRHRGRPLVGDRDNQRHLRRVFEGVQRKERDGSRAERELGRRVVRHGDSACHDVHRAHRSQGCLNARVARRDAGGVHGRHRDAEVAAQHGGPRIDCGQDGAGGTGIALKVRGTVTDPQRGPRHDIGHVVVIGHRPDAIAVIDRTATVEERRSGGLIQQYPRRASRLERQVGRGGHDRRSSVRGQDVHRARGGRCGIAGQVHNVVRDRVVTGDIRIDEPRDDDAARDVAVLVVAGGRQRVGEGRALDNCYIGRIARLIQEVDTRIDAELNPVERDERRARVGRCTAGDRRG